MRLTVNDILRYGQDVQGAVESLVANGTPIEDISFENSTIGGYDHTPSVPRNNVFNSAGGGLSYKAPSETWLDPTFAALSPPLYGEWFFPANVCMPSVGTGGATCDTDGNGNSEELIMVMPYVREDVCFALNRRLGLPLCAGAICSTTNDMDSYTAVKFQGTFADGAMFDSASGASLPRIARANTTVPTGFCSLPPSGPAMPLIATAISALLRSSAPLAIA